MDLLKASVTTAESDTGPYTLVELSGEADVTNSDALREVLDAEIAREPRTMVIDLAGLRFMDSSALHVILRAMRAMDRQGWMLALARPTDTVARMLHLTATDQLIPVYRSVSEAVSGLGSVWGRLTADKMGGKRCLRRRHVHAVMACVLARPLFSFPGPPGAP